MSAPKKIKVTISCEVETSFYSYGTKKENDIVRKHIKEAVREALVDNVSFIGFEDPRSGDSCSTQEAKIWVFLDE